MADMWFQDDATCHTVNETIQLLHETFPGRVLSPFGDQNWPPKSRDLTLLDFFLWGYLKSMIYVNNHTCIREIKCKRKLNAALTKFTHNYAEKFGRKGAYVPDSINNYTIYFMIRLKNKYLKTKNSLLYLIQILR